MANIRILGLDDNDRSPIFIGEDGTIYQSAHDLVDMLSKPHTNHYEVKMFVIVDDWSEDLLAFDDETIDHMFYFLEGISTKPDDMEFDQIFNLFWKSVNCNWW